MEPDRAARLSDYYTPEERLLILASRTEPTDIQRIHELLADGVDWETVLATAESHRIVSLLYRKLRDHCGEQTPDRVLNRLRTRAETITKQNLRYTQAMLEIVQAARDAGIRVLPYRGPVLAEVGYGGLGLRQFGDIDLLIAPEDIDAMRDIVLEHGYEPDYFLESTDSLTDAQEQAYEKYAREVPFQNDAGVELELHWQVTWDYFPTEITLETVWNRRQEVSVAGTAVAGLSPEDRLLMLLVHGSRHAWERLGWVVDIDETVQRLEIAWDVVWARAEDQHCQRMVALGLLLARDLFGTDVPAPVARYSAGDETLDALREQWHAETLSGPTRDYFGCHLYHVKVLDRRRDVLRLWLSRVSNPGRPSLELVALPASLLGLYRLVRVYRLLVWSLGRLYGGSNVSRNPYVSEGRYE